MRATGYLIGFVVVGTFTFFFWSNQRTNKAHLRFTRRDVQIALEEVLSEDSCCHDAFDLFLGHPIGDPFLESIRQRCIALVTNDRPEPGRDISHQAADGIRALLKELQERP
ncbi:MAG: hypothetical protein SNJ67_13385 [Chloracidobacterium sp.]